MCIRKRFCGCTGICRSSDSTVAFSTWLYRIVANLCLDQIRRRKVRKEEPASVESKEGEFDRFQLVPEERADVDPQRTAAERGGKAASQRSAGPTDTPRAHCV